MVDGTVHTRTGKVWVPTGKVARCDDDCICKCSSVNDCIQGGAPASVGLVIGAGDFEADHCSSCGDISGTYSLTGGNPYYYWADKFCNCAAESCNFWDLALEFAFGCHVDQCGATLEIYIRYDPDPSGAYQRWSYSLLYDPPGPAAQWVLTNTLAQNVNCVCGFSGKCPYKIDVYPATFTVTF